MSAVLPAVPSEETDALIASAQDGDEAAFGLLYARLHPTILGLCRSRLGDRGEASDITQEAFLRAWLHINEFHGTTEGFRAWLSTIAVHLCCDHHRRAVRIVPGLPEGEIEAPPCEEPRHSAEQLRSVRSSLQRLSPKYRNVLVLREFDNLSYADIADRSELTLEATRMLLWRARRALRREYFAAAA